MSRSLARIVLACTLLLATLWWVAGAALPVHAATTITDCPASEAALTADITSAGAGGIVQFSCDATLTLASTIALRQSVTIDGNGHAVTLDGGHSVEVFYIYGGLTATLNDLTIADGNSADYGGGIANGGTLTVTNSTFRDNSALIGGGAIDNEGAATLTVTNSTFSGNSVTNGYGPSFGGAIDNNIYATLTLANSTFSDNSATGYAGGIANGGTLTVTNSTFSGNSATYGRGGGIANGGTLTVTNSTFSGNSAPAGGGLANTNNGTLGLSNSTFSGNSATSEGGGIYNIAAAVAVDLTNTIVANSPSGGNCAGNGVTDLGGNVDDGTTCIPSTSTTSLFNTNPLLGALAANGGATQTIALQPGSAAIDFTSCLQSTDQRGDPRPDAGEARCDSGAYEYQDVTSTPIPPIAVTVSGGQTYGSASPSFTPTYTAPAGATVGGSVSCTTVNGGTAIGPTLAAGSYPIDGASCSGLSAPGYSFAYTGGSFVVAKASQTIDFGPLAGKTYGDAPFTVSATAGSGLPVSFAVGAADSCTIAGGTVTITGAGSCTVTASQAGDTNYNAAKPVAQTFSIAQKALTITASSATMAYGDPVPAITPLYSGLVNGDAAPATAPTCGTTATGSSGPGVYPTSCSGAVDPNYTIQYQAGTLTIAQATPSISWSTPEDIVYGTALGATQLNATASVPGTFAYTPPAGTVLHAGSGQALSATFAPTDAADYTTTAAGVAINVTPAPLTVTAKDQSMVYGGSLPGFTAGYSGFVNGDDATTLGGTLSCTTTATAASPVGTYPITCSGQTSSDYSITYKTGTLTINPAPLTITADNQGPVQYSDALPAFTWQYSGFVNGEGPSVLNGTTSCTTTAGTSTVSSPAGSYPITCSGQSAANYTITYEPGTLTVSPETAAIQYTGGTWAQLPSSGSATIALQAQVWDSAASGYPSWGAQDDDGLTSDTPGDADKMYVQWEVWPAGGCLSGAPSTIVGPVPVTATSAGVGTASASFSQSADGSFCVVAQVVGATPNSANGYYTADDAQVAGIAFYTDSGQSATGGGWINDGGSSTGKGTFGFNARYGKNGSPKGQMVYVWHGTYNGVPADFVVKSNALTTLSFTQNGASSYSATLQGKCSYTVISEVDGSQLYSEGNDTFSATVTDGDNGASQQNSSADSFALTTFQSGNTTLHPIATTALGGGNVAVHN